MRVGGLGEFESVRKTVRKEDARQAPAGTASEGENASSRSDAVQISAGGRALGKLRQAPEVRQAEIDRVLAKMRDGSLGQPEELRASVERLLGDLLSGRDSL